MIALGLVLVGHGTQLPHCRLEFGDTSNFSKSVLVIWNIGLTPAGVNIKGVSRELLKPLTMEGEVKSHSRATSLSGARIGEYHGQRKAPHLAGLRYSPEEGQALFQCRFTVAMPILRSAAT